MNGKRLMGSVRRRPDHVMALPVEVGRVMCPSRGSVDIERCFACGRYRGLLDGRSERLLCAPVAGTELAFVPFGTVPR